MEVLWLRVRLSNASSLLLAAVYRPPSPSDIAMVDYLCSALPSLRRPGEHGFLAGDFNLRSVAWLNSSSTTPAGVYAEGRFADLGFHQLVIVPTRGTNTLAYIYPGMSGKQAQEKSWSSSK